MQHTLKLANEMDSLYLEEMKQSLPVFAQAKAKGTQVYSLIWTKWLVVLLPDGYYLAPQSEFLISFEAQAKLTQNGY